MQLEDNNAKKTMIKEYIKKQPNNGKLIIYTEAYLQMRRCIMEQISSIENAKEGTLLSNDEDVRKRLLPGLKRMLKGLQKRFEKGGMNIDVKCCAQYILDMEQEQITDPLKCCRYYTHQDLSDNNDALFADYEKRWIEWNSLSSEKRDHNYMVELVSDYMCYGLLRFDEYDKAPISLKALLFNRFCHWDYVSSPDAFKEWFHCYYCKKQL